ncbi:MAG: DUF2971 domain-containing protein [Crocinitomicaceae bacterium]|nr:DUF2971 domain-containing protein [Crocinitomicaceae bacterium]
MIVYKYRGGNEEIFLRDLKALEENCFYAPTYEDLNDPCEAMVSSDRIDVQTNVIGKIFGGNQDALDDFRAATQDVISSRKSIGIYSLSNSKSNELLWAHYANGHRGYCLGYETKTLLNDNMYQKLRSLSVKYSLKLPKLSVLDINNDDQIINKLIGTKSKLWSYEKETRIISDVIGKNYYEHSALKSICFGLRMNDDEKERIMKCLKGRCVNYFQITQEKSTYGFGIKEVPDLYQESVSYLNELEVKTGVLRYRISSKTFKRFDKKGQITVYLKEKILEEDLLALGKDIKNKLFSMADKVFMFYLLDGMEDGKGCWATTHYDLSGWENSIHGLTIEQEQNLTENLRKNPRDNIGMWIDDQFGGNSSLTLYEENGKITLETQYPNDSVLEEEVTRSEVDNIARYDSVQDSGHGEYFEVDKTGILRYYSPDGLFKTLNPFRL